MKLSRLLCALAVGCGVALVPTSARAQVWWDDDWPYRVPVAVAASGPVSVAIDFGALFAELGIEGALLDLRSVRVVSYDGETPVGSLPYAETYSVLLEDGEAPQLEWSDAGIYWRVNDGVASADSTRFSAGNGSVKALIQNLAGGYGYPGVEMLIASGDPRTDWSRFETLVYDVWPAVNEGARDQAPDLYSLKIYDTTGCDSDSVTQGGPPLALDRWNPVSVSLRPLHTCTTPSLTQITRVELHTRDNDTAEGKNGFYDDGDELTLWLDEIRLVDHNEGTIAFEADGHSTAFIYFDTLEHEGHPLPERISVDAPAAGTVGSPEAGGYLHTVTGSSAGGLEIWSAPSVEKVPRAHVAPTRAAPLLVSAAKAEYEPFQLVVRSGASANVAVTISDFTGPAGTIAATEVELHRVDYVELQRLSDHHGRLGAFPDPLYPLAMGSTVTLPAGDNQPLWFTVHVPRGADAGIYDATVSIGPATVPVSLRVFDFELPPEIHLAGGWNFGWSSLVERYRGTVGGDVQDCYWDLVDALYEHFAEHRLNPTGTSWPAGLNYPGGVEYDCAGGLDADVWGIWGFGELSTQYTLGGALADKTDGFPAFQIDGPASNWPPDSRPSDFCGETRGTDPPGNAGYNGRWFEYWTAVSDYLGSHPELADRGYYHIVNEPQTFDDYNIVAYLAELTKAAAPNVRILLSEQVEPFIHASSTYPGAKIDVWMPTISTYEPEKSHARQLHYDEQVWWYFLYGDRPPLPNPTIIDRPGIEARVIPWLAWAERVDGLFYYSLSAWDPDPWADPWPYDANGDGFLFYPPLDDTIAFDPCNPQSNRIVTSLRWELLRDGMEDYEMLWVANGGYPAIGVTTSTDALVSELVASRTLFSRVPTDIAETRERVAQYITGELCLDTCAEPGTRCQGTALVVCELAANGCLEATTTDCEATAQGTCDEVTASCVTTCANECAEGAACEGNELVRCEPDALGCLVESRTPCDAVAGGYCDSATNACVDGADPAEPGGAGSDDDGCGCRIGGDRSARNSGALAVLLALGSLRRRRPTGQRRGA